MGQAAVDLPDPLNPPAAPSAASTDDLLAQLAGEEIDRMLAEADAPAPQKPAAAPVPELLPPIAPPAARGTPVASDAAQLNNIFRKLEAEGMEDPVAAVAAIGAPGATKAAQPGTRGEANPFDEDELLAAERGALNTADALTALTRETDDGPAGQGRGARPSLLIRTLEWINSPLESCPEETRETMGKIAILTTVNAVAILAYVLFFRRHG